MRKWRHLVPSVICISTAGVGRVVARNTTHQSQLGQQEKGPGVPVLGDLVCCRMQLKSHECGASRRIKQSRVTKKVASSKRIP
ncbi:hypothetical protein NXS19_005374 [Fusarium pseudograminearum]|nr:hypothetical protein NXS19_005374 [Fusarium pseudograminearum]